MRTQCKGGDLQVRKRDFTETKSANNFIFEFQATRSVRNKFMFLSLLSL